MKDSAAFAARFFESAHIRRILLGGTDENITAFRAQLPKSLQSLIMGAFPMAMIATHAEVGQKAMAMGKDAEMKREAGLVRSLLDLAGRGSGAVTGLEPVLQAVNDHRVNMLLALDTLRASAQYCSACGLFALAPTKDCPGCGEKPVLVDDAIDLAVYLVLSHGGAVEILTENEELHLSGGIGALLRY
jgi:peptide subunit release factor 1 (eRF1)